MASQDVYANWPPSISEAQQKLILERLKDYALGNGLAVKPAVAANAAGQEQESPSQAVVAPVTIYPSLFPNACYEQAIEIQATYNELYASIADDEAWLEEIVPKLADLDDFVQNMWQIHLDLREEGYAQPLSLGLFRSDYMVHLDPSADAKPQIRQVEFNTIASSFGGLSTRVSRLHRHLALSYAYSSDRFPRGQLVESHAAPRLARGLAEAHKAYISSTEPVRPTCILFIVQANERNIFDQKHIENELVDTHDISVFRVVFDNASQQTSIEQGTHALLYKDAISGVTFEVSVIYYRAGYSPTEYTTEAHWTARRELERSRAIKCPTILTQLAGMKKVQQVLAAPNSTHMQRFLPTAPADSITNLERTFAPMYPLDGSPAGLQGRQLAVNADTARRFVLKPQREGGGNNIYRAAIPAFLRSKPEREWDAYILMEMIEPPAQRNAIVRDGGKVVEAGGVICELGVYGTCLWRRGASQQQQQQRQQQQQGESRAGLDTSSSSSGISSSSQWVPIEILHNDTAGYLLRTKGDQSEEGGVAAGFGALDSLLLIDI